MFKFRKAKIDDIPKIINVMDNTGYISFCYKNKTKENIKRLIKADFSNKIYLVCIDENSKIIGYFIFGAVRNCLKETRKFIKIKDNYAYHFGIGIYSKFRGRGIGLKFTKYALNVARKQGYLGMYADVSSANIPSIRLQEKAGFQRLIEHNSKKRYPNKNIVLIKIF